LPACPASALAPPHPTTPFAATRIGPANMAHPASSLRHDATDGSHDAGNSCCGLLCYGTVSSGLWVPTFRNNTPPPALLLFRTWRQHVLRKHWQQLTGLDGVRTLKATTSIFPGRNSVQYSPMGGNSKTWLRKPFVSFLP
jgi:hypothetical protein